MDVQSITPSNNFISHHAGATQAQPTHSRLPLPIDWEPPRYRATSSRRARGSHPNREPGQHRKNSWPLLPTRRAAQNTAVFQLIFYLYIVKMMVLTGVVVVKQRFCDAISRAIANRGISLARRARWRFFTRRTRIVDAGRTRDADCRDGIRGHCLTSCPSGDGRPVKAKGRR
jgi:hypothetical protein